jgi:hypothetical protein
MVVMLPGEARQEVIDASKRSGIKIVPFLEGKWIAHGVESFSANPNCDIREESYVFALALYGISGVRTAVEELIEEEPKKE